ncbi:hypothetical protein EV714DRAFT_208702 [Schizophyllum commune]
MVNKSTNKQRAVLGDSSRRDRSSASQAVINSGGNRAQARHANAAPVAPTLPGHIPDVQCDCIADLIRAIRDHSGLAHRPTYDIESSDIAYTALTPEVILLEPIQAPRLRHLTIRGNNSDLKRQRQHTALLTQLRARDLQRLSVLRPGRSSTAFDTQLFNFLMHRTDPSKLTYLALNMWFIYRAGLQNYLKSTSAANLETLRLKTNADIQACLVQALVTGTQLPALRTLIVRIKKVVPSELVDALVARHHSLGDHDVLHTVEIAASLSQAIIDRARRVGITLRKVPW